MSHKNCPICKQIMSALNRPLWFCRLCRSVREEPRVVRHHLSTLIENGRIQTKNIGGIVFYRPTRRDERRGKTAQIAPFLNL